MLSVHKNEKLCPRRVIIREHIHLANGWPVFGDREFDVFVTDSKFSGNEQQNV